MGLFPGCGLFIAPVARSAAISKMRVSINDLGIDKVSLVLGLRRHGRRCARSPDPFR